VAEHELLAEKQAYQQASRSLDLFVSGLAGVLLVTSVVLFAPEETLSPANVLELTGILFFALALIASLRKMEQSVTVLGTSYTILDAERNWSATEGRAQSGTLAELRHAVQIVSLRAAKAHRIRNWLLVLGICAFVAVRVIAVL
jgi:hypothetical protein